MILLAFVAKLASSTSRQLCACINKCPRSCEGKINITLSNESSIDAQFRLYKAKKMNIAFEGTSTKYVFVSSSFEGSIIKFHPIDQKSSPIITINFTNTEIKGSHLIFKDVATVFQNIDSSATENLLSLQTLTIHNSSLELQPAKEINKINVQRLYIPTSLVNKFSTIVISGGLYPDLGIEVSNAEDSITLGNKEAKINDKVINYAFNSNPQVEISSVNESNKLTLTSDGSDFSVYVSTGIHLSMNGDFKDFKVIAPKGNIILESPLAIIPYYIESNRFFMNINIEKINFTSHILSNISITTGLKKVVDVHFLCICGSIDMMSSYLDVTVDSFEQHIIVNNNFNSLQNVYTIGTERVSRLTVKDFLSKNDRLLKYVSVRIDFDSIKSDEELKQLIDNQLVLFDAKHYFGSTFIDEVEIQYQSDSPKVHGFTSSSNCLSVIVTKESFGCKLSLKTKPPSQIELTVCYSLNQYECSGFISVADPADFATMNKVVIPNMKNVAFKLGADVPLIDLTTLDQSNKDIKMKIFGTKTSVVTKVKANNLVSFINLSSLTLDESTIEVAKIEFRSIIRQSGKTLKFAPTSDLTCDGDSIPSILDVEMNSITLLLGSRVKQIAFYNDCWGFDIYTLNKNISKSLVKSVTVYQQSSDCRFTALGTDLTGIKYNLGYRSSITFDGDWLNVKSCTPEITIYHLNFDLTIKYTQPMPNVPVKYEGTSVVEIQRDFKKETMCVCPVANCTECAGKEILFDDLDGALVTKGQDITISIYGSSTNTHPKVKTVNLDLDMITFVGMTSDSCIEIDDSQLTSLNQTTTAFRNLTVITPEALTLGDVLFENCVIPNLKTLNCFNLSCTYQNLYAINQATPTNAINLSGSAVDTEKTFDFTKIYTNITVASGSEILFGGNQIKIGKLTLTIDKVTIVPPSGEITISPITDATTIPDALIFNSRETTVNFKGDWTKITKGTLNLTQLYYPIYNLYSEHIPALIWNTSYYKVVAKAANVGFKYLFHTNYISSVDTFTYDDSLESAKISLDGGFGLREFSNTNRLFFIAKAKLTIIISEMWKDCDFDTEIGFKYYVDLTGCGTVQIGKTNEFPIDNDFAFFTNVTGVLTDEQLKFFDKNYTIISGPNLKPPKDWNIVFQSDPSQVQAHGFNKYGNSLGLAFNNESNILYLVCKTNPISLPYLFGYGSSYSVEKKLSDDEYVDISAFVPPKVQVVEILYTGAPTKSLNLDLAALKGKHVILHSSTQSYNISINVGTSISKLTLDGVNIVIAGEYSFNLDKLTMQRALVISDKPCIYDNVKELAIDTQSYTSLGLAGFNGKLTFNAYDIVIEFSANGWNLSDFAYRDYAYVEASKFPNLAINSIRDLTVNLKKGTTTLHTCPVLIVNARGLYIGKGWEAITSPITINIESDEDVYLSYASLFTPFKINGKVAFSRFSNDAGPLTIPKGKVLSDYNETFEFTQTLAKDRVIYGSDVTFTGESAIEYKSSFTKGQLVFSKLTLKAFSKTKLYYLSVNDTLVMETESKFHGIIYDIDNLEFHWMKDRFPSFDFVDDPLYTPSSITFILDEPNIDGEEYNSLLYGKSFEIANTRAACGNWISSVTFKSSIPDFDQSNSVFDVKCIDGKLLLNCSRKITYKDDSKSGKKLPVGAIVGISFAVVAVVAVSAILIYKLLIKNERKLDKSALLMSAADDQSLF